MNNLTLPLSIYFQEGVRLLRCGDDEQAMNQFSYACLLWMDHLAQTPSGVADDDTWYDAPLRNTMQQIARTFKQQDIARLGDIIEYQLLPLVKQKEDAE